MLPFVQRIINSSYNARTQVSPADLIFGNSVDLSGVIYYSIVPHTPNTNTQSESMDKMIKMQTHLIKISKKIVEDSSDREHNSSNSSSFVSYNRIPKELLCSCSATLFTWHSLTHIIISKVNIPYLILLRTRKKNIILHKWKNYPFRCFAKWLFRILYWNYFKSFW